MRKKIFSSTVSTMVINIGVALLFHELVKLLPLMPATVSWAYIAGMVASLIIVLITAHYHT